MNFIEDQTAQKLRGGYYTPDDLAGFLAAWVNEISPQNLLEPSCGDGVFIKALAQSGIDRRAKITCFELDKTEASKAKSSASSSSLKNVDVRAEDFLGWAEKALDHKNKKMAFDAVVGNPPFVRYQYA